MGLSQGKAGAKRGEERRMGAWKERQGESRREEGETQSGDKGQVVFQEGGREFEAKPDAT